MALTARVQDFLAYEESDWSLYSPWMLRMEFDKRKLLDKKLEPSQIASKASANSAHELRVLTWLRVTDQGRLAGRVPVHLYTGPLVGQPSVAAALFAQQGRRG